MLVNPALAAAAILAGREWCSKEPRLREAIPSAGDIGTVAQDEWGGQRSTGALVSRK